MSLPELGCACATVRRASRLVTRMYDRHLREFGLEASQYALLMAIHTAPGKSQTALTIALGFEKATLSRNLKWMAGRGWVTEGRGVSLTAQGSDVLERAKAGWTKAQAELRGGMNAGDWDAMQRGLHALTAAARAEHREDPYAPDLARPV